MTMFDVFLGSLWAIYVAGMMVFLVALVVAKNKEGQVKEPKWLYVFTVLAWPIFLGFILGDEL